MSTASTTWQFCHGPLDWQCVHWIQWRIAIVCAQAGTRFSGLVFASVWMHCSEQCATSWGCVETGIIVIGTTHMYRLHKSLLVTTHRKSYQLLIVVTHQRVPCFMTAFCNVSCSTNQTWHWPANWSNTCTNCSNPSCHLQCPSVQPCKPRVNWKRHHSFGRHMWNWIWQWRRCTCIVRMWAAIFALNGAWYAHLMLHIGCAITISHIKAKMRHSKWATRWTVLWNKIMQFL